MAGNREEKQLICDNAELMAEWDWDKNNACELYPDKLSSGSNKKAYWKCSKSHEWREEIYKRSHGKRCPYCANKRVWIGYNDLNTLYPALAKEWNKDKNADIDINSVVPGSQKKCGGHARYVAKNGKQQFVIGHKTVLDVQNVD